MNVPAAPVPQAPGGDPREPAKSKAIKDFDKTTIYQQIVAADSVEAVEDLERKIELIEAIQRVSMLETLPETALYFLEQELEFHRYAPKSDIFKLQQKDHYENLWLIVEGQVMVLGSEPNGATRVVNILKKGEYFLDKPWLWAGLPVVEIKSIMPTQVLQIPASTLNKIAKVSSGVRKRLKAMQLRMDKRAEKFGGEVGKIWNYLVRNGYSYSERVRVIRLDKCIDCDACYIGCETRHGHARIWKSNNKFGLLRFPDACRTCEFQHCTQHCAGDHIVFDPVYREVLIKDTCTGCTHCETDCPYGVIKMVEREDQPGQLKAQVAVQELDGDGSKKAPKKGKAPPPDKDAKKKMIAIKCDHCFGHQDMACVTPCPTGAIFDLSQRELFERVDLYGLSGAAVEEAATIRPAIHEDTPGERGRLHAVLWSLALMAAAVLGWESWARSSPDHVAWSFSWMIARPLGYTEAIYPIEAIEGLGRWFGWVGSWLLTLTLMYVPRKRLEVVFRHLGSRQAYLDVHVFFGLMGFVFASYHTTFELDHPLWRIPFFACMLVVVTGIIGRYFYSQLPRTVAGNEMRLEDAKAENAAIEGQLAKIFPDTTAYKQFLDWSIPEAQRKYGLIRTVLLMFTLDLKRNAKLAGLRGRLLAAGQTRRSAKEILQTIKRKANLEQKILLYEKSRRVAKVWLVVHVLSAIVMFLLLAYHIKVGVELSGWIGKVWL